MPSQAKVTATVDYRADENSYRAATQRTKAMGEEYKRIVDASNRQAADFAGREWQRTMAHAAPGALPLPGFAAQQQAMQRAIEAARAPVLSATPYGPFRQTPPDISRPGPAADIRNYDAGFVDRSAITVRRYNELARAQESVNAQAAKGRTGLLELSHAMQDFQAAGLKGVANNLPLIFQGAGFSAKTAGAAMMAGVAGIFWSDVVIPAIKADFGKPTDEDRARIRDERARADAALSEQHREASDKYVKTINYRIRQAGEAEEQSLRAFERGTRLQQQRQETERVQLNQLEGSARIQAESAMEQQQIAESTERIVKYQLQQKAVAEKLKEAFDSESRDLAGQIAALEKRKKIETQITASNGQIVKSLQYDAATAGEIAALQRNRAAAEAASAQMAARIKAAKMAVSDAEFEAGPLAGQQAQTARARAGLEASREATAKAVRAQKELAELSEQRRRWAQKELAALQDMQNTMAAFNRRLAETAEADQQREVDRLRAHRRTGAADRMERGMNREKRIRELMDGPDALKREDAEKRARQEEADSRGRSRRGADTRPNTNAPSGLDAFDRTQRSFTPQTPSALDEARRDRINRPTASERAAGKDKGDPARGNPSDKEDSNKLLDVLRRIEKNTAPPSQDKLKPVPK